MVDRLHREIPQCYASPVRRVTSRQNPTVAQYRDAARGAAGSPVLLDGPHLLSEALAAGIALHHVMVAADALGTSEIDALVATLSDRRVPLAIASPSVMSAVSPVHSGSPIAGLATRPALGDRVFSGHSPVVFVVCDVQDPGNLGAIVRISEAAGLSGLIVAGTSCDPFAWKALRGSMGSALRLPIATRRSIDDAFADVCQRGCRTIATSPRGGQSLFDIDLTGSLAVFIGGEGQGLPSALIERADARVTIPMQAPVESLNAAVTAALVAYEARRQRT